MTRMPAVTAAIVVAVCLLCLGSGRSVNNTETGEWEGVVGCQTGVTKHWPHGPCPCWCLFMFRQFTWPQTTTSILPLASPPTLSSFLCLISHHSASTRRD